MEDIVRQSPSFVEQFVVGDVTQLVERRQVCRAVPVAARAIQRRVDALAVWCFGETAPRTGDVRQSSDDGGTVDVLQSIVVQSASSYGTRNA